MTSAFLAPAPLSLSPSVRPATCPSSQATSVVTMGSRRDLKKEKSLRNLEFARAHRKRVVKRQNRRAIAEATANADNEFLSSIYGTMRFGAAAAGDAKESSK